MLKFGSRKASVLIMVLWALTLLAVFAVQIGVMTRDKISFLARAERQSLLRHAAKGGISKALAVIKNDQIQNQEKNLLQTKLALYFNPSGFRSLEFGLAEVSVLRSLGSGEILYGITDEQSRLNLNTASRESIRRLLIATGVVDEEDAEKISAGIYDWREYGESEIEGFSSDDFYDNLQFPYPQKKADYEVLEELLLVDGVTEKVYTALFDDITVYGNGAVNMNTASWRVLTAWGLTEEQAKMVATIRRGVDGIEGTLDDFLFQDAGVLFNELAAALGIVDEEREELLRTYDKIPFVAGSDIFRVHSVARMISRPENKSITCVFDAKGDKIMAWRER